jgi:hypothetical protein
MLHTFLHFINPLILINKIFITLGANVPGLSTGIAEHVTTNPAMVLSVEESKIFLAHSAFVHFLVRDPYIFLEHGLLLVIHKSFNIALSLNSVRIHLKNGRFLPIV